MSLDSKYNPQNIEDKWYKKWLDDECFKSSPNPDKEPFTIVIPPPNVTGVLHMGHMLNNSIQDILTRRARMKGKEACWVPGTDHASIATEAKVVAMLKEKGIDKDSLSRDEFLKHAWEWKEKYGGIILEQLKKNKNINYGHYICSNSIKVPLKLAGWIKITGFPWAPSLGMPSPRTLHLFLSKDLL